MLLQQHQAASFFSRCYLNLLPAGTTSNESLHHDINSWFRRGNSEDPPKQPQEEARDLTSRPAHFAQRGHVPPNKPTALSGHCTGSCEQPLSAERWAVGSMVQPLGSRRQSAKSTLGSRKSAQLRKSCCACPCKAGHRISSA